MDEVVWNVALGSAALGGTAAGSGGALNSLSSSWTPALDELVLKVDRKSKMRITHGRHVGTWSLLYRKIISALLPKDLDVSARNSFKEPDLC